MMPQLLVAKKEAFPPWGGALLLAAALVLHAGVAGVLYLFSAQKVVPRLPERIEISFEPDPVGARPRETPPEPSEPEKPSIGKGTAGKIGENKGGSSRGRRDGATAPDWIPPERAGTAPEQTPPTSLSDWTKWVPLFKPNTQPTPLTPGGRGTDVPSPPGSAATQDNGVRYLPDKHGNLVFTEKVIKVSINPQTGEVTVSSRAAGFVDAEWGKSEVRFGVGQLAEKLFGGDPYASRKIKILYDPETQRVLKEVWSKIRSQRQYRARSEALAMMDRIAQSNASWEQKKRAVFQYWIERDQDPGEDSPGSVARRAIDAFVRTHFAQGSLGEFTAADLEAMNKEAKRQGSFHTFHPYK